MPKQYTQDEVRGLFLGNVWEFVHHWHKVLEKTEMEKLEGLAQGILAILDGESELPAFIVAPMPCLKDEEFLRSRWGNWFPENNDLDANCNISGSLHEIFAKSMSHNKESNHEKCVLVGKHTDSSEIGMEILSQTDIIWHEHSKDCMPVMASLLLRAQRTGCSLVFRDIPGQANSCLYKLLPEFPDVLAGQVVTLEEMSAEETKGYVWRSDHLAEVVRRAIIRVNPNVEVLIDDGTVMTVKIPQTTKLKFSHIEWLNKEVN